MMNTSHDSLDVRSMASMDKTKFADDPSPDRHQRFTNGKFKPKICLAMPLYNQTKFLEKALQSLLAQTYSDFRLLVVDDSTEPSPGYIVKRYAAKDSRIQYIKNESRKGMVGNWRACFKHAGDVDYFAWVGDHDVWHPEWLEKMVDTLSKNQNAVLVYPVFVRITSEGSVIDKPSRYFSADNMSERRRIRAVCRDARAFGKMVYGLFRTDALQRAGVFRRVMFPDVILMHELSLQGDFKQVKEKLWFIRRVAKFSIERQKNALFIRKPWYICLPWPLVNAAALAWNTAIVSDGRSLKQRCLGLYVALAYFFRYIGKFGTGSWIGSYDEWVRGKKPWIKKWKQRRLEK
jgi:glycosyltransferase involved in cell wall biosynthesis